GGARKPHARRTFCTLNVRSRAPHSRRWAFFSSLLARRSRAARTGAVSFSTGLLTLGPWVVRTALADLFAQMLALLGRHLARPLPLLRRELPPLLQIFLGLGPLLGRQSLEPADFALRGPGRLLTGGLRRRWNGGRQHGDGEECGHDEAAHLPHLLWSGTSW